MLLQLVAAVTVVTSSAKAAPPLELDWQAPVECPPKAEVEQRIEQQRNAKGAPAAIAVRIRIAKRTTIEAPLERYGLELELRVNSVASHRSLNAESCAAAADAAVLMIGLALDSRSEQAAAASDIATASEALRPPRFELAGSSALVFSTLPGLGWGAMLHFGVAWESLRFIGSVAYYFPRTVERGGASADIDLLSIGLAACYLYVRDPIALGACGQAEIGRLSGAGQGIDQSSPGSARIQTFGVSWQLRVRLISRVWIFSDTRVGWNERRPRFTVEGLGLLHAPREVALRFVLGPLIELE